MKFGEYFLDHSRTRNEQRVGASAVVKNKVAEFILYIQVRGLMMYINNKGSVK